MQKRWLIGSFHDDFHPHPRMNAALKIMLTLREIRDLHAAALKDSRPGHCDVGKASSAFRDRVFSWSVESRDESAAEMRYFREGVWLTALIDDAEVGSFLDPEGVWLKVPARIRSSVSRLCEQVRKYRECAEGDVFE